MGTFVFLIALFGIVTIIFIVLRGEHVKWYQGVIFVLYILFFLLMLIGFIQYGKQYDVAIDPVDDGYIPLGQHHILTMIFYFITYQIALGSLWFYGKALPPLYLVTCLIFVFIGLVLNTFILIQVRGSLLFTPFIVLGMILGMILINKVIRTEKEIAPTRRFKNKFLDRCNYILGQKLDEHAWALLLFFPVVLVISIILILFGQDYNSLVKAFTETTTWQFSQQEHPPSLSHEGHYLCTVSAKGSPSIVKPIRLGTRGGRTIIINRQLQIANAFEELISDFSPKLHRLIRTNYDKYGYNLSLKINSQRASNITYILMKPLEWFFLCCLYFFALNPEKKISRQYQLGK